MYTLCQKVGLYAPWRTSLEPHCSSAKRNLYFYMLNNRTEKSRRILPGKIFWNDMGSVVCKLFRERLVQFYMRTGFMEKSKLRRANGWWINGRSPKVGLSGTAIIIHKIKEITEASIDRPSNAPHTGRGCQCYNHLIKLI